MAELRVISAGAGTGKTWRLARELLDALTDPTAPVAPEGVVAVTFTRTAAAELEQRVRTALIDAGQLDLARRLAAARIGTVHAVCARLIEEYAFPLGLSPEIETIDDVVAASLFDEALAAAVTDAQRSALDDLEQRFALGDQGAVFFRQVRVLVNRARGNEVDVDELDRSCAMSVESLRAALPPPATAAQVERQLQDALEQVLDRTSDKGADAFRRDVDAVRRAASAVRHGEVLPWSTWSALEESRFRPVAIAAARHLEHPAFGDDLERMCRLVFDVARQTLRRYADDKRAAGVVDFTDQERLAVAALEQPEVAQSLAADVQLLLVDEFQDTSPLQLRLFNALRKVTRRTVIVGDEKQSIFGFRDARPEFFALLAHEAASTDRLGTSYRSRPGLVRAVSAVFAEAFSATHRPDEIALDAALQQEPPGLGPIVERWTADQGDGGERVGDEQIIAAGIAEILSTRDVLVRPRASGEGMVRPAQARDVAVLCRTNSDCRKIARALHRRGVPVVHAQRGLSKTFEARLMGAALGLWLDDRDALSRVALVQLLEADRDDVAAVVARSDKGEAFVDHAAVVAVVEGAKAAPWAGLVQAFDRIVDELRIPEHLAGLSEPQQRLADLAALRALAVRFVEECVARGRGPTIAGYLDRLETLRTAPRDDDDSNDDNRGVVAGEDAVTVLTWHRAKGKEWPLVVLANLWMEPQVRPFEPVVETTVTLPDLQHPGFGQWLRFWPTPYADHRKSTLLRTLMTSPVLQKAEQRQRDEDRRLLYVAFTRARDRLILVGDQTLWSRGMLRTLQRDGRPLCGDPPGEHGVACWAGVDVDAIVHKPFLKAKVRARRAPLVLPERPTGPRPAHPPMFLQPSAQEGSGVPGEVVSLGAPVLIKATTRDELNPVGVCVHAFLAWDAFVDVTLGNAAARHARAAAMVERFAVKEWLTPTQLLTIADQLWRGLDARFPGHRRRTEVPMLHRLPTGTLMRGQLDLLLDLPDGGAIVVDHKTTWDEAVVGYAGQLAAYKAAVVAAGATDAVQTWIHLPLHGRLVEVTTTATPAATT